MSDTSNETVDDQGNGSATTAEVELPEPDANGMYDIVLPDSAQRVQFRMPGMLGQRRIHEVMPILDRQRIRGIFDGVEDGTVPDEIIDGMLRIVVVMCVAPRFTDAYGAAQVRGVQSLDDLSMPDCQALMQACTGVYFQSMGARSSTARPTMP